jgi:ribonuclease HI
MWKIFTDGGARGNPGEAACAFVIMCGDELAFETGLYLGYQTNNEAEYWGVIHSLEYIKKMSASPSSATWFLDSKLVVEQITGRWRVKEPRLQELQRRCLSLLVEIFPHKAYRFQHIPRGQNTRADHLVNVALDSHLKVSK